MNLLETFALLSLEETEPETLARRAGVDLSALFMFVTLGLAVARVFV